jgi:hypothetical protein
MSPFVEPVLRITPPSPASIILAAAWATWKTRAQVHVDDACHRSGAMSTNGPGRRCWRC